MATVPMARRHDRLATRLPATILAGARRVPVTVLSLSELGFACEGAGLEGFGSDLVLHVLLQPLEEVEWSPKAGVGAAPHRLLVAPAELLYVDFPDEGKAGRLAARFRGLDAADAAALGDFVALELFRRSEWRTRGGAVPAPPAMAP